MPPASAMLRLVAFAVPSALAMAGVQPLLGAATGTVDLRWAVGLALPALLAAGAAFGAARLSDRGDVRQPRWYAAWMLMPGAFLLAGAAAMCIFGALVELALITWTLWVLLGAGLVTWSGALVMVRSASR